MRSTEKSESHGVYLLDLQTEQLTQMIDWDDQTIDFTQRGGDRGLRGIAFHEDRMFLAAVDEIFVYDPSFRLTGSIKNPYLRHCHEINTGGGKLFLGRSATTRSSSTTSRRSGSRRGIASAITASGASCAASAATGSRSGPGRA